MTRIHLDFETYSEVNIKKVTTPFYTSHPSTEILMLGWAVDDEPVNLWQPRFGAPPDDLLGALTSDRVKKHAFNAPFERGIIEHKMGIKTPIREWRCTQVESLALSFPAKLDMVLDAIGLEKKDKRGENLINRFCSPAPKTHKVDRYYWGNKPDEWQAFCEYCIKDVEVERELYHWLQQYGGMSKFEWELWYLDQEINARGLPIDAKMAKGALEIWSREKAEIIDRLHQITKLEKVTRGPFLAWLQENGCEIPDTQKDTIKAALKQAYPAQVLEALALWSQKEVRAIDKYQTVLNVAQEGRVRGVFQFAGASRTRRWAGRTFQPHNLKRTLVDPSEIDMLAEAIRRADKSALEMFW